MMQLMRRRSVLVAALVVVAAACSGSNPASSAPSPSRPPSPTPSATSSAPAALVVGGDRPVTAHLPPAYDASRPAPLLLLLHGYSSRGEAVDGYFGMRAAADAHGFVYATPDGTLDGQGNRFWNATDACCNFDRSGVDDVAFLSGIISEIQAKVRNGSRSSGTRTAASWRIAWRAIGPPSSRRS
jgi:polyhydroxybutyrate depolymerase